MLVVKFGGTSVGSVERIKALTTLVVNDTPKIVVLSAMSGTTNTLVEIANYLYNKNNEGALETILTLEKKYKQTIAELFSTAEYKQQANDLIDSHFSYIRAFTKDQFTMFEERAILAQGELLSTALFNFYLHEIGVDSVLLPALNFMRINEDEEPDAAFIK